MTGFGSLWLSFSVWLPFGLLVKSLENPDEFGAFRGGSDSHIVHFHLPSRSSQDGRKLPS